VALGAINTGIGFWLFYALTDRAGAGRASLITYVTPAVAALLGIGVLGEGFGVNTAIGLALILGGAWLASGGRLPTPRRTEPARR
jgi:drug/metabolite transporter (DMT)-like permease